MRVELLLLPQERQREVLFFDLDFPMALVLEGSSMSPTTVARIPYPLFKLHLKERTQKTFGYSLVLKIRMPPFLGTLVISTFDIAVQTQRCTRMLELLMRIQRGQIRRLLKVEICNLRRQQALVFGQNRRASHQRL